MYIYIYIYIYIYVFVCCLVRKSTGENIFPQKPKGNLFCFLHNCRKSPETSGDLWGNVI